MNLGKADGTAELGCIHDKMAGLTRNLPPGR